MIALGSAVTHTHAPGNVGLRGDASCPACRLSGVTLSDEQQTLLREALDALGFADDPESLSRQALVEVLLRSAEQQRDLDRRRVEAVADAYEQSARETSTAAADVVGDASWPDLIADAARNADRARAVRRVRL